MFSLFLEDAQRLMRFYERRGAHFPAVNERGGGGGGGRRGRVETKLLKRAAARL